MTSAFRSFGLLILLASSASPEAVVFSGDQLTMRLFGKLPELMTGYCFAYLLLATAGGFSDRQRAVLSLVGPLVLSAVIRKPEFTPFWVLIEPDWDQLFVDHGIDRTEAVRARSDCEQAENTSDPFCIGFIVLGPKLFYSTSAHRFFSELGIHTAFDARDPSKTLFSPGGPQFAPTFYVRERFDFRPRGYHWEFGLITNESRRKRRHEFDEESMLMPVARIPRDFFWKLFCGIGISRTTRAYLEKKNEQAGWKRWVEEGAFVSLRHKYLTLSYGSLSTIGVGPYGPSQASWHTEDGDARQAGEWAAYCRISQTPDYLAAKDRSIKAWKAGGPNVGGDEFDAIHKQSWEQAKAEVDAEIKAEHLRKEITLAPKSRGRMSQMVDWCADRTWRWWP